jgi:hypothetical protein
MSVWERGAENYLRPKRKRYWYEFHSDGFHNCFGLPGIGTVIYCVLRWAVLVDRLEDTRKLSKIYLKSLVKRSINAT